MIRNLMSLLKPAQHLPEIQDAATVDEQYQYWRIRIFYSMYVGYLFYYFTRNSFNFIKPFMCEDLHLTKGDVGFLSSILAVTYGISKFTSGILCDRSNPRYFMAIGIILTGICNILFGLSSSLVLFTILWILNGWFQGWGWPACTKQLTHWFSHSERGTWWSVCTTSHTAGGFAIAYVAAFVAAWYGWRFGMFVPGILCIGVGCWLLNRLRDVPQSLGLPSIEKYKGEEGDNVTLSHTAEPLPARKILFEQVLNNKYVWILSISYFFVYVIRTAAYEWGNFYLIEMKGYSVVAAAACVSWFEIGGFFGILIAGWGSDRWFQGRRVPYMVLSSLVLVFAVLGLWYLVPGQFIVSSCLFALIGFLVFGPQMLVGLAAAESVKKEAASTSNGFAGCFGYLGAAMAGFPLGKVIEIWGWYGFVVTLAVCSLVTMLVLAPMWSTRRREENVESEQEKEMILVPETVSR